MLDIEELTVTKSGTKTNECSLCLKTTPILISIMVRVKTVLMANQAIIYIQVEHK